MTLKPSRINASSSHSSHHVGDSIMMQGLFYILSAHGSISLGTAEGQQYSSVSLSPRVKLALPTLRSNNNIVLSWYCCNQKMPTTVPSEESVCHTVAYKLFGKKLVYITEHQCSTYLGHSNVLTTENWPQILVATNFPEGKNVRLWNSQQTRYHQDMCKYLDDYKDLIESRLWRP